MSRRIVLLALLTAGLTFGAAAPAMAASGPSARAAGACPGAFNVLHNERIGSTTFPAAPYRIVTSRLSCQQASLLFARFLDDFDGILPGGWKLIGNIRRFVKPGTKTDFQVTPIKPTPDSLTCPGTFQVDHSDHIGTLVLPQGGYLVTLLSKKGLNCDAAAANFAQFLDYDQAGILPRPWNLDAKTSTFSTSSSNGFSVKRISSGGGERHPGDGRIRCPGTFRVQHNDRIGALRLPAGPYVINAFGGLGCQSASSLLRTFLRSPSGNLPAAWVMEPQTGTFIRGGQGFQVEPAA